MSYVNFTRLDRSVRLSLVLVSFFIFSTRFGNTVARLTFPHLSPTPLIVPCTCRAPADTAIKVFAAASPLSL